MALPVAEEEAAARHYERLITEARERSRLRQEQNRREREALEKVRELHDQNARPINIAGYEVLPGGRIIER